MTRARREVMEEELLFRSLTNRTDSMEEASVKEWRRASLENERIYQELAEILVASEAADRSPAIVAPAPLRLIHAARARGTVLPQASHRRTWLRGWQQWLSVASAAAVAVLAFALLSPKAINRIDVDLRADEFVTGAGETATLTLRDGTVVRLGPESRVRLPAGTNSRQVALQGRAFFAVAKDPAHPFVVETSSGRVEVLGTRFDVNVDEELQVVVVEGRVLLSGRGGRQEVRAGELGRVVQGATLKPVSVPDVAETVSWMGRFLAFEETPLREAAREIEQVYGVRIEITDPGIASQTITTWFADQSVEQVMQVLCMVVEARCTAADGEVIRVEPRKGR